MRNQVIEFLELERKALRNQIEKCNARLEFVEELLKYADSNFPENTNPNDSLFQDMMDILKAAPGTPFSALELRNRLRAKWERHPSIIKGKQDFQKRIWGTMNYIRHRPGIRATRKGKIGYIEWRTK